VELAHREWISNRQAYWLRRLGREHANLRAAVQFCLDEPAETTAALQIVLTVPTLYWWAHGRVSEGRSWLGRALAQGGAPGTLEARALLLAAHLAIAQGDVEAGMPLLERGTQLARRHGTPAELAYSTHNRGVSRLFGGDVSAAVELYERSLIILSTAPEVDPELRLNLLHSRGVAAALIGDHQRTSACYAETLAITEPVGEDFYRSKAMWFCGLSFWRQRDLDQATTQALESLRVKRIGKLDDLYGVAQCVELLAWTAAGEHQHARAATLLGAADKLRADMGISISKVGHLLAYHDACEEQTRTALGEPAYLHAFREGQDLSCDETLAFALQESRSRVPAQSRRGATALTRREQQIAELIAQGLSNKEIANTLVISQRTAESHVERILAKFGFNSRAQVATWVTQQQANGT
jgi:non-specific serine/threonine protein kinase